MTDLLARIDAALARVPEGFTAGPWKGDRRDGTVKYDMLGADDSIVIHGDNGNSGSDTMYGVHEPDGSIDATERLIMAAPTLHALLIEARTALVTARREAIEECARVCETRGHIEAMDCASLLRALATREPA